MQPSGSSSSKASIKCSKLGAGPHTIALQVLAHRRHKREPNVLELRECLEQLFGLPVGVDHMTSTEIFYEIDLGYPAIDIGDQAGAVILGGHPRDTG